MTVTSKYNYKEVCKVCKTRVTYDSLMRPFCENCKKTLSPDKIKIVHV